MSTESPLYSILTWNSGRNSHHSPSNFEDLGKTSKDKKDFVSLKLFNGDKLSLVIEIFKIPQGEKPCKPKNRTKMNGREERGKKPLHSIRATHLRKILKGKRKPKLSQNEWPSWPLLVVLLSFLHSLHHNEIWIGGRWRVNPDRDAITFILVKLSV